jgi:hypothetical protein
MTDYLEVLKGKYPAKEHARKVADHIVKHGGDPNGVIYLEGQKTRMIEVINSYRVLFDTGFDRYSRTMMSRCPSGRLMDETLLLEERA